MLIRFWLALCLLLLPAPLALADVKDVYTIRDISVDEQAASIIEAREKAMNAARLAGAKSLINKITLADDRAAAGGVPIDTALASRFAAAVDVQEEQAGAGRYRGKLAVVFNPRTVRAHLDALKVPYVDTQAPLAIMAPVAPAANLAAWRTALGERNVSALSPYLLGSGAYSATTDWSALSADATTARARRGLLSQLEGRDGAWRVKLSLITPESVEALGTTATVPSLEAASRAAVLQLDEAWKRASIVRSDAARTNANAEVLYTSLTEWNTLRGALVRSPLVSGLKVRAVAKQGAYVSFNYAGDAQRLRSDLLQRGVSLSQGADNLVLRSAVSAGTP